MSCKEKKEEGEKAKERRSGGNEVLCKVTAHNLKKTIMRDIKETESDIADACMIFHEKHEQKTGKRTRTISEFEQVTRDFSKLTGPEIEKLINEGKEEDKKLKK
jgi:hypothetical protein